MVQRPLWPALLKSWIQGIQARWFKKIPSVNSFLNVMHFTTSPYALSVGTLIHQLSFISELSELELYLKWLVKVWMCCWQRSPAHSGYLPGYPSLEIWSSPGPSFVSGEPETWSMCLGPLQAAYPADLQARYVLSINECIVLIVSSSPWLTPEAI